MQTDKRDEDVIHCVQPSRDKIETELPDIIQMGNMKGKKYSQDVECAYKNGRVHGPEASLVQNTSKSAKLGKDNEICIEIIEGGVAAGNGEQLPEKSSCAEKRAGDFVEDERSAEDIARCSPKEM